MLALVSISNVGEAVVWAAAVVGATIALFRVFGTYILAPYARGRDAKDDARLRTHLAPLKSEVSEIRAEVRYNGGTSLKDGMRRIERRLARLEGHVGAHDQWERDWRASSEPPDATDDPTI